MKIGQLIYPQNNITTIEQKIYALSIYSCPGNKFLLDDNEIVINNYGNFTIDFGSEPINKVSIVTDNLNVQTIPIIIDYYYEEG